MLMFDLQDILNMCRFLILFLLSVTSPATAENSLRLYYVKGDAIEQITDQGVTVTVSLKDTGKLNRLSVYVDNRSADAVNIVPSSIALHQNSPKYEELPMKSERELQNMVGRRVFWGQVIASLGAGLSRNRSTITTSSSYGSMTTVVDTPDYEGQARWLAEADQLSLQGQAVTNMVAQEYLRTTTVFPGSSFAGMLWFKRDKAFGAGVVRLTIGSRLYEFPFPAPASTPAPVAPVGAESNIANIANGAVYSTQQNPPSTEAHVSLGISGADWEEAGYRGVEILQVSEDGAASLAGLHPHNVITDVNGKPVRSTKDLANLFANVNPGSRVVVGYAVKTNLGWMPKETIVILPKSE